VKQTDKTVISERAKEFIDTVRVGTNCKVILVSPENIPPIWDNVIPLMELSQNGERELSIDDFFESLMEESMHLWIALEGKELLACMITQFATHPQKRSLRIIFLGGEGMDKWIDHMPMVEDFALMNGCTSLEVWGRKAWLRILKDWECKYHIITKDLTARMH
jgi:hypothetical protein